MLTRHRVIFIAALAVVVLAFAAPPASAAPCWQEVIDDWADNSRVDSKYPVKCYQEALANLPEDMRAYSSAHDDIDRSMRVSLVGGGPPGDGGTGSGGLFGQALDQIGPRDSSSFPVPLLIVGALAGFLVVAGGLGLLANHLNAGRARSDRR